MNLSELPPFEKLLQTWDHNQCIEMINALNFDLENLLNRSSKLLNIQAKMREITVEEFISQSEKELKNKIRLIEDKINSSSHKL
jgi:hypothetical protein